MKTQEQIIAENKTKRLEEKTCEYCCEAKAEGYVKVYNSYVCEECYEDNHGTL